MPTASWSWSLIALLLAGSADAAPLDSHKAKQISIRTTACTSLKQRVDWNTLTKDQKKSYIDAVKCLKTKPKQTNHSASQNLFDDFPAVHVKEDKEIHSVAVFLPWHRRYLQARENALQSCGYAGPTPYWDWTKGADTGDPRNDPIFSPDDGFGGIGSEPTGESQTVTEGPFANFDLEISSDFYGPISRPHQLRRTLEHNPNIINGFNSTSVHDAQEDYTSFNEYRYYVEGTPHGAVHTYIGGDMMPSSSPNDPLFFLHHAQIDRMWAQWQEKDRANRINDYAGNYPGASSKDGPFHAHIDDLMPTFGGLISDVKVRDVMDTKAGDLCYEVSLATDTFHSLLRLLELSLLTLLVLIFSPHLPVCLRSVCEPSWQLSSQS